MSCPHCDGDNLEVLDESYQEHHHIEIYQCEDCGCVFRWEAIRTIESRPDEEDRSNPKPLIPLSLPLSDLAKMLKNPQIREALEEEDDR